MGPELESISKYCEAEVPARPESHLEQGFKLEVILIEPFLLVLLKEDPRGDAGIALFARAVEAVAVDEQLCDSVLDELRVSGVRDLTASDGLMPEEHLVR